MATTSGELRPGERLRDYELAERLGQAASEFEREISPERATEILESADGVVVTAVPNPLEATGKDEVFVGRIRADQSVADGKGLTLFVVGDNLRKGAALNAVQVAEVVAARLR